MYPPVHNLPPLVLKARHLNGSAFCLIDIGLPEQAVGGFPLGSGLVVEDRPSELSYSKTDNEYDKRRNLHEKIDCVIHVDTPFTKFCKFANW